MKQRKVLVGIAIAIFIILLLYWLLVAEDMKPWLSAMVPSVAQQFFAWFWQGSDKSYIFARIVTNNQNNNNRLRYGKFYFSKSKHFPCVKFSERNFLRSCLFQDNGQNISCQLIFWSSSTNFLFEIWRFRQIQSPRFSKSHRENI